MGTLIYTIKTSMGRIQPASWPYLEIGMGSGKGAEGASPWCGLGRLWEGLAAQQQVACRQKAGLGSRPALPESRPQGQHALGGEGGRGLKAWRGDWDTCSWGSPPPTVGCIKPESSSASCSARRCVVPSPPTNTLYPKLTLCAGSGNPLQNTCYDGE